MKITIPLLLLCLFLSFTSSAQSPYSVKGMMIDSASKSHLLNTSISVLNDKDSTLRKFTRADATGAWAINGLTKGKFLLLITYPGYADYVEPFILDSVKQTHDFGKIYMTLKSRLLQQVIIKGTAAAIKMKGDTTEFNAAAFKIQPNSKVEDLLKQLPGITVDKDGKITAQGEAVPKVLVDGEEFFGDDPTLVTKNLRADMVDKVQLYDKKSDQATFTGVDDGQKTKTINIKLKEDKKNGYFGKLEGGYGTGDFYTGQALFNKFKAKQKLSAYAIASNTGKVGLGWEDQNKYGGSSNNVQISDDGYSFISFGGGSDLDSYGGQYDGRGIPKARTGGIHYDNKWDADKKTINTNYKIGYLGVDGTSNTQVQNNLPSGLLFSNTDQSFRNSMFRQKVDAAYTTAIDTSSNLKLTFGATVKNSDTNTDYLSNTKDGSDLMINRNIRTLTNKTDGQLLDASAFYTKKFAKKRRTLSWNISESINNSQAKGYLNSRIDYYNKTTGNIDSTSRTDQYKTTDIKSSIFNSNIAYTEPLSKKMVLSLNYGLGLNNSTADRKSFNQSAPGSGIYNVLDTQFSNDYKLNQLSNQLGAMFNYTAAKVIMNFGTKATDVNFKQVDQYTGNEYTRHFLNLNPQANLTYKIAQQRTLSVRYSGNPTQPSIDQIQPIRVNTDPLNISLGNPDLKPSFNNSFSANYNSYKVLTDSWIGVNGGYNFTTGAIVSNNITDATGKSTYQSINLQGHNPYNVYFSTYIDKKIKKIGINFNPNVSFSNNVSYSYSNGALNTTTSYNYSARLGFSKYVQKKFDFSISGGPSYTKSGSSLQPDRNNNGYGIRGWGNFNVYLPGKLQVGSDLDYQYRGKTQSFDETFSRSLLNASISKTFLKQDNLKFTVSGNDLLNQNTGFSQNAYGNTITRSTNSTIRRYIMFSLSWDFNKMGGGAPAASKN